MKNIIILGAGTAGTMMANHLQKRLKQTEWQIKIIDKNSIHYYQPGFLFLPFDIYKPKQVKKPIEKFIPKGVELIRQEIDKIEPAVNEVRLSNGDTIPYDILIIATGTDIAPASGRALVMPLLETRKAYIEVVFEEIFARSSNPIDFVQSTYQLADHDIEQLRRTFTV